MPLPLGATLGALDTAQVTSLSASLLRLDDMAVDIKYLNPRCIHFTFGCRLLGCKLLLSVERSVALSKDVLG